MRLSLVIQLVEEAVDPAEAERLLDDRAVIERLAAAGPRPAGQPDAIGVRVMSLEPCAPGTDAAGEEERATSILGRHGSNGTRREGRNTRPRHAPATMAAMADDALELLESLSLFADIGGPQL